MACAATPTLNLSFPPTSSTHERSLETKRLHILQLVLVHSKVMAEFVNDCQAYLFADFGIVVAYGFDILLIKNNVVGSRGKVKGALFRSRQTVKKAQKQLPLCSSFAGGWLGGKSSTRTAMLRMR